jgi:hypothetical protein
VKLLAVHIDSEGDARSTVEAAAAVAVAMSVDRVWILGERASRAVHRVLADIARSAEVEFLDAAARHLLSSTADAARAPKHQRQRHVFDGAQCIVNDTATVPSSLHATTRAVELVGNFLAAGVPDLEGVDGDSAHIWVAGSAGAGAADADADRVIVRVGVGHALLDFDGTDVEVVLTGIDGHSTTLLFPLKSIARLDVR